MSVKHKVTDMYGWQLDVATAMAEGWRRDDEDPTAWWPPAEIDYHDACASITRDGIEAHFGYHPASNWAHGGPIIERERITLTPLPEPAAAGHLSGWIATPQRYHGQHGSSALEAAMRAYVASKFGDEVELPD